MIFGSDSEGVAGDPIVILLGGRCAMTNPRGNGCGINALFNTKPFSVATGGSTQFGKGFGITSTPARMQMELNRVLKLLDQS